MDLVSSGRRFGSFVLDWILCLLVAGWFGPLNGSPWPLVALLVTQTFFIGLFGQTPGGYVARIRCVSMLTGGPAGSSAGGAERSPRSSGPASQLAPPGLPRAALRAVLVALLVPALIRDADGRGLHDRAAGTVVVDAPRG